MDGQTNNPLENIKVGDQVTILKRNYGKEVAKVTHVTPKQFVADDYHFWKKDGRSLRAFGYAGTRFHASIVTQDELRKYKEEEERKKLARMLTEIFRADVNRGYIPLETLRDISHTIKGFMPDDDD